jgi:D-glycero-D-manno-heptose 1,7-bisphosphate phosphatase
VLTEERGYVTRREDLRLLPGAAAAVRDLGERGYSVVIVSNQSAVARGLVSAEALWAMHAALVDELQSQGGRVDGVYVCPHHPEGAVEAFRRSCECRKPAAGLLRRAAAELDLLLDPRSVLLGDQLSDLLCARAAGVRPALARTGKGASLEEEARAQIEGLLVVDSVKELGPALAALR